MFRKTIVNSRFGEIVCHAFCFWCICNIGIFYWCTTKHQSTASYIGLKSPYDVISFPTNLSLSILWVFVDDHWWYSIWTLSQRHKTLEKKKEEEGEENGENIIHFSGKQQCHNKGAGNNIANIRECCSQTLLLTRDWDEEEGLLFTFLALKH